MVNSNKDAVLPKLKCENCGLESSNYSEVSFYGSNMEKLPEEHIEYYLTEGLDEVKHSLCGECVKKYK